MPRGAPGHTKGRIPGGNSAPQATFLRSVSPLTPSPWGPLPARPRHPAPKLFFLLSSSKKQCVRLTRIPLGVGGYACARPPAHRPPTKLRSVHWTFTFFSPTPTFLRSVHWTLCKKKRGRPAPMPPYYPTPSPLTQREGQRRVVGGVRAGLPLTD